MELLIREEFGGVSQVTSLHQKLLFMLKSVLGPNGETEIPGSTASVGSTIDFQAQHSRDIYYVILSFHQLRDKGNDGRVVLAKGSEKQAGDWEEPVPRANANSGRLNESMRGRHAVCSTLIPRM